MATTSVSLLKRLRHAGEDRAWSRFVELYTPLIYHWALGVGLSIDEAEDLVQDVFSILVKKLPEFQYDQRKSFRGWLRTVTLNRCRDLFRRCGTMPTTIHMDNREIEAPNSADLFSEQEYGRYLVSRALDLMQTEFEGSTWKACWQCVVDERPASEVARELGITVNAVYVAKSRVLRRLRKELDGLFE